jgi:very-short-patch-repair endonuclease
MHEKVKITRFCEKCKKPFVIVRLSINGIVKFKKKEKRFCSKKCSNSHIQTKEQNEVRRHKVHIFYNDMSQELKDKWSKRATKINKERYEKTGQTRPLRTLHCLFCGEKFSTRRKKKKCCSRSCDAKYNIKIGKNLGWSTRTKFKLSYAEKFFVGVLNEQHIPFVHDKKVGLYFIDFALNKNVALEIDGKQHNRLDRKEHDKIKDDFLIKNGWYVYRIKWKSINKKDGCEYIKNEIVKFIEFYQNYQSGAKLKKPKFLIRSKKKIRFIQT